MFTVLKRIIEKHRTNLKLYVAAYAIMVIGFAAAYSLISEDFYSTTIRFEPDTIAFKQSVQDRLAKEIRRNMQPESSELPVVGPWRINGVIVWDLEPRDKWITARVNVMATSVTLDERFSTHLDLNISALPGLNTPIYKPVLDKEGKVQISDEHPIYYMRQCEVTDLDIKRDRPARMPIDVSDLFPCRSYPGTHSTCVEMSEVLEHDLTTLSGMLNGHIPALKESVIVQFLRMLYFSVVTITTVGYGDIVPLTILARVLVTLEAFLGPLLLGFFLAAVGMRLSSNIRSSVTSEQHHSITLHHDSGRSTSNKSKGQDNADLKGKKKRT